MCFTININTSRSAIEKRFGVDTSALQDFEFRYFYRAFENPLIPVVSQDDPEKIQLMHWGLIPHWVKSQEQSEKIRKGTYNARAETLNKKPSFRGPYKNGRCWVPVNGFFEWQDLGNQKIPWYICSADKNLLALAGLCDTWIDQDTGSIEKTFTIVTTRANPLLEKIHNTKKRMPVILTPESGSKWLEEMPDGYAPDTILTPYNESRLKAWPISRRIGQRNADPFDSAIIERVEYGADELLF